MMKKIFLSAILSAASILAVAQTQNVTHVVQRGETIESIAEYYHVNVDDINKANPNTDGLIYVGMKLVVPTKTASSIRQETKEQNETKTSSNLRAHDLIINKKQQYNNIHVKFKVFAGITVGQWTGKDFKDGNIDKQGELFETKCKSSYGFHLGANIDYLLTKRIYAGIGLMFNQTGYKKDIEASSGEYWNDEGANYESKKTKHMTTNKFDIPIHIGGTFDITPSTKIYLEAGPLISYAISGQNKTTGYMTIHEDIHSGETEHYNEKVKLGKGELKQYQKVGYGLSATAGVSIDNIFLQFTYQRSLSKTIKKTKQYEQNLLLSIGYSF